MKQQTRSVLPVLWVAVTVIFIGLAPQIRAEVNAESNDNNWVQTNGPYGGDIGALYAAPKGVLFVGTDGAGIFRSTDRGDTWTPVNTGLDFEPGDGYVYVTAFAQKGDTLYAGTRAGLYTSTDDGDTWHLVPSFQKYIISGIVTIADRLYISTLKKGVWYSDDGTAWQPMNCGFGEPIFVRELSSIGTTLIADTRNGFFRKRAHEDSWMLINDVFVLQQPVEGARIASRIHGTSFASMGDVLYVGCDKGIFRSYDEGNSWAWSTPEKMTRSVTTLAVFGATLYAGTYGGGIFRSDDRGNTWRAVDIGLKNRKVSVLLAVNEDTVFVGTRNEGIFRTVDGGNSWVEINTGLTNTTVSELEVIGDKIYTSVSGKIVYSADGGELWKPVKIPSMPIKYGFPALSVSDGELYVGAVRYAPRDQGGDLGGIFRLDAESNTLVELIVDGNLAGLECMEVVGMTFYIGTLDNGVIQWERGLGPWTTNLGLEHHYIWILSANGERVYAGTGDDEIYHFQGEQWEPIHSTDMMDGNMSDLKWVGSTLYATFWNGGVFRSVNGGDSWISINDGLDEASATSIGTDGTELYVGTFTGVFQWIEDKKQWEPIGSLPHQILSLAVLDGFLYAGTAYSGVFKIPIEK